MKSVRTKVTFINWFYAFINNRLTRRRKLTYRGPRSHLWATGAKINHNRIIIHIFRLREKIAIKRISTNETLKYIKSEASFSRTWYTWLSTARFNGYREASTCHVENNKASFSTCLTNVEAETSAIHKNTWEGKIKLNKGTHLVTEIHFHMKVKCFVPDRHRRHHRWVHPGDFYLVALVSQQLSENLKMKINYLPINIDPKKNWDLR